MTTLNPTLNPINAQERVKINENWDRIMQRFSSLQYQINILSGETSVEDILSELNSAISNANSTVQGLVDTSNQSITNVNQKITEVDGKLVELQTAIDNANLATNETNSAITDARQAIADINAYFENFRFVGEYNATTTYYNFNFVRYQKSTFVSLKENLGITPNDDGINWRLVAVGGIDGMGAVASVNGKNPDSNGEVTLIPTDIGAASSNQINETNNNLSTLQQQVTTHLDEIPINIKSFGAKGDGINDDAPAIHQAIIHAVTNKKKLYIPQGVFLLKTFQAIPTNTFLPLLSNLHVFGDGEGSILKITDNLGMDGHVFYKPDETTTSIDNLNFENFAIDFNGQNNLVPQANPYRMQMGIGLTHGKNVRINNVIFRNNAGQQCVSLGSNTSPHTISNVEIDGCKFLNVGKGVSGNVYQVDHSCIYVQSNGVRITNNRFQNDWYTDIGTAIEDHSNNAIVEGNQIINFATGVNIVATVTDKITTLYQGNQIKNVRLGFHFWNTVNFKISNISIISNQIEQTDSISSVFDISTDVNSTIDYIAIRDNDIKCVDTVKSTYGHGVLVGKVKLLLIKGNKFEGLRGRAVSLGPYDANENEIIISGNEFVDCGATTTTDSPTYKDTLVFFGLNKIKKISITNNEFYNRDNTFARVAINGNAPIGNMVVEGNNISNCGLKDIEWDDVVTIDSFYLQHKSTRPPDVRADIHSVWVDMTTKTKYIKHFDVFKAGWRKEFYSVAIPTETASFMNGDKALNIDPQPSGYIGWVFNGVVWKGFGLIQA